MLLLDHVNQVDAEYDLPFRKAILEELLLCDLRLVVEVSEK
jgi:hypothetical protein